MIYGTIDYKIKDPREISGCTDPEALRQKCIKSVSGCVQISLTALYLVFKVTS